MYNGIIVYAVAAEQMDRNEEQYVLEKFIPNSLLQHVDRFKMHYFDAL